MFTYVQRLLKLGSSVLIFFHSTLFFTSRSSADVSSHYHSSSNTSNTLVLKTRLD